MTTLIIGKRSNLSKELNSKITNSKVISSDEFLKLKLKSNSNLIINAFFPSFEVRGWSSTLSHVDPKHSISKLSQQHWTTLNKKQETYASLQPSTIYIYI